MGRVVVHSRGIITYYLSPVRTHALHGWLSNTLIHVSRHIQWQGVLGLGGTYAVMAWGDAEHERLAREHRF